MREQSQKTARERSLARLYKFMGKSLDMLPDSILKNPAFKGVNLATGRLSGARTSEFYEGWVHMFQSAEYMHISRYLILFLHEVGHGLEEGLLAGNFNYLFQDNQSPLPFLRTAHRVISDAGRFLGTNFLAGERQRRGAQASFTEFIPELFMIYISQGNRLRQFIRDTPEEHVREMWEGVYEVFRIIFEGVEYYESGEEFHPLNP